MGKLKATTAALGALTAGQSQDAEAGTITKAGRKMIEAFHGSPHKFDKFSMDSIGTGEGAQAYGHGLYFADSEDVARGYRDTLTRQGGAGGGANFFTATSDEAQKRYVDAIAYADGAPLMVSEELAALDAPTAADAVRVLREKASDPVKPEYAEAYSAMADMVESGDLVIDVPQGSLYKVHIDADPDTLLDWDKPLSEQSEAVQALAQKTGINFDAAMRSRGFDGETIYQALGGGNEAAAKLREAGIPGLKYLDGGSRAKGEGSYNYVMFDDAPISIQERGMATPEMLAATGATAILAQQFMVEHEDRSSRFKAMRDDITTAVADAADFTFDSLEIPWRGILGLSRMAGGLLAGESFDQSLAGGAQQIRQPVEQTAYDLGGAATDYTGSPGIGAAVNAGVQMGGPI